MHDTGRTGRRRASGMAAVIAVAALAFPAGATAQAYQATVTPPTVELTGYFGAIFPMSVLGSQGDTLKADVSTKPAFGAGLEYWFGGGFGLGVAGGFASPGLALTTADLGTGEQDVVDLGTVDYLHGEALLLWRPQFTSSAAVLLPYFGAGAGIRRLDFEDGSGFEDSSDVTIVLNAGTQIWVSEGVHLRLDVRDLISSYEGGPFESSDLQHDLFVQVGLGLGL